MGLVTLDTAILKTLIVEDSMGTYVSDTEIPGPFHLYPALREQYDSRWCSGGELSDIDLPRGKQQC